MVTIEQLQDALAPLQKDISDVKKVVVGDEQYHQLGLIERQKILEEKMQKLNDYKVWVLGACAAISAIGGIVISIWALL